MRLNESSVGTVSPWLLEAIMPVIAPQVPIDHPLQAKHSPAHYITSNTKQETLKKTKCFKYKNSQAASNVLI